MIPWTGGLAYHKASAYTGKTSTNITPLTGLEPIIPVFENGTRVRLFADCGVLNTYTRIKTENNISMFCSQNEETSVKVGGACSYQRAVVV
jgi:hypothetical protein